MPTIKDKSSFVRLRDLRERLCKDKTDKDCNNSIIIEQLHELNGLICDEAVDRRLLVDKLSEIICLISMAEVHNG